MNAGPAGPGGRVDGRTAGVGGAVTGRMPTGVAGAAITNAR